ncbi:hypothetical protein KEHDKFFH_08355 [Marinobacter maroccanus]|uniref:Glycosyltransferase family 1 protein n=1 Tax=Marinobacter maroccanus TaxID=2055143 RepID=A0A2S5ZBV4_9GAMM|nr:glycosyltransferase [Marinobacter maroccanus]PPI84704.1 hypothetical protein KEHDKFFH_08355 [Marinobacter maroccanus]
MPAIVTHIASGDIWAGAEVQVYQLLRGLLQSGEVQPTAVLFNHGVLQEKLEALGIPVTVADESSLSPLRMIASIRQHLRAHRSNLVHTHGFKENVLGVAAQRLAGVPVSVRTVHGSPEYQRSWKNPVKRVIALLDQWIGRYQQDAVVAVSQQLKSKLEDVFPRKTKLIYNFFDVESLQAEFESFKVSRSDGPVLIGFVGRLVPVKRVDLFIETIERLTNQHGRAVKGIIIGDGPLRAQLEKKVRESNLVDQVEFLGFVNPAASEIAKLDMLLMTSDHEGLPMTLIEALALSVPVVAHNVGGVPEALGNGRCGVLVDEHSPAGYAIAVNDALNHVNDLRELSDRGRQHAQDLFGAKMNTSEYVSLYRSLLN